MMTKPNRPLAALKRIALQLLVATPAVSACRRLLTNRATIFMLHRFRAGEPVVSGHDPDLLRAALEYLRKHRYPLIGISELFRRLGAGEPIPDGSVAFTIDDGYFDQATVGAPVFSAFDCPVTTFVTTGFLDGDVWFWWDQIEYIFRTTALNAVRMEWDGSDLEYDLSTPASRDSATGDFIARCKRLRDGDMRSVIHVLAERSDVALPEAAPPEYAPMSWHQLRKCESGGMTFGPHTVTHPILANTDNSQSEQELRESWTRLREEASDPVSVFCYPNGTLADFGDREIKTLKTIGFIGAVTGVPGYASHDAFDDCRFYANRYVFPPSLAYFIQHASGFERLKDMARGAGQGSRS